MEEIEEGTNILVFWTLMMVRAVSLLARLMMILSAGSNFRRDAMVV